MTTLSAQLVLLLARSRTAYPLNAVLEFELVFLVVNLAQAISKSLFSKGPQVNRSVNPIDTEVFLSFTVVFLGRNILHEVVDVVT